MKQILESLADSPQDISLITVSIIVSVATVINLIIGMQNMKLTKALKIENTEQNSAKAH